MITRKQKQEIVKTLGQKLEKSKAVIFTDFTGVSVPEIEDLRRKMREKNLELQIIKKNLLKRAYPDFDEYEGPVAVALGNDEISLCKILSNSEKIKILSGKNLSLEQIQELAKLPTQEELLAKFIYLLKNNLSKLILCLKQKAQNMKS